MKFSFSNDKLERHLSRGEEALNLLGYVPFLSILSASVRSLGGIVQAVTAACIALGYFILLGFYKSRQIKHIVRLKICLSHLAHGICNIVRAKIEAVPFLSLVVCLPYDRLFKKRFRYAIEAYPDDSDEFKSPNSST